MEQEPNQLGHQHPVLQQPGQQELQSAAPTEREKGRCRLVSWPYRALGLGVLTPTKRTGNQRRNR